jgi:hypothetical protein
MECCFELTVPNNAKIGHVITKLGCSDFGLALQVEGNPQDDQLKFTFFSQRISKSTHFEIKHYYLWNVVLVIPTLYRLTHDR